MHQEKHTGQGKASVHTWASGYDAEWVTHCDCGLMHAVLPVTCHDLRLAYLNHHDPCVSSTYCQISHTDKLFRKLESDSRHRNKQFRDSLENP